MRRYYSHLIILPDGSHLEDFVVELNGNNVCYYPFVGEIHSTAYLDSPVLLSHRCDLEGKTVSLNMLTWALQDSDKNETALYVYILTPCDSCSGNRFVATKL